MPKQLLRKGLDLRTLLVLLVLLGLRVLRVLRVLRCFAPAPPRPIARVRALSLSYVCACAPLPPTLDGP